MQLGAGRLIDNAYNDSNGGEVAALVRASVALSVSSVCAAVYARTVCVCASVYA